MPDPSDLLLVITGELYNELPSIMSIIVDPKINGSIFPPIGFVLRFDVLLLDDCFPGLGMFTKHGVLSYRLLCIRTAHCAVYPAGKGYGSNIGHKR